jgi:DNA polymerase III subunit epsilon
MDAADTLVFVDLETTGGNPAHHRITEVGIVRVENGVAVDEWSSLINPECLIPAYIEAFTGISNEMVAHAPRFSDIAPIVAEKLAGAVFVAHNARFDYSFLRSEFLKLGVHFSAPALCTVKLSRRLYPQHPRHNLDAVMARHGLTCSARHRALGDARVLKDFWFKLRGETESAVLAAACAQSLLSTPKLPAHLPPELADELPDGCGVYRFFGEGDVLLYIGRSNALRARVLAQLSQTAGGRAARQLCAEVRRVDWQQCSGELGAMLLEANWLRTQMPRYNRRRRSSAEAVTLRPADDGSGRIEAQRIDALEPADLAASFGVFHCEQDALKALADIARAQQLCLKVLGLEQSAGSCFALQMGKCRGGCAGREPRVLHDMRARMALSSLKIMSWPFAGRIALRERVSSEEFHVLDHWTYLGTARSEQELADLSTQGVQRAFDTDVYRILARYFANHSKLYWHDVRAAAIADQTLVF